jgi:hypothetical protein
MHVQRLGLVVMGLNYRELCCLVSDPAVFFVLLSVVVVGKILDHTFRCLPLRLCTLCQWFVYIQSAHFVLSLSSTSACVVH